MFSVVRAQQVASSQASPPCPVLWSQATPRDTEETLCGRPVGNPVAGGTRHSLLEQGQLLHRRPLPELTVPIACWWLLSHCFPLPSF